MAAQDLTLALTGAVQRLTDALVAPSGVTADALAAKDVACQQINLPADGGNSNPIYIGTNPATLSTTVYGNRIEKAAATVPPVPLQVFGQMANLRPSDLYVLGSNGDKLHALLILA